MKKHIPNAITMMNLFSGCIAIVMAFEGKFQWVVFWVIMAAAFDFFDGFVARLLHVSSRLGVELDSLADVISFGVAPATAIFTLLRQYSSYPDFLSPIADYIPYLAYLTAVFSAMRLGKFNIDERQTTSFIGLPTPANALFWISYCFGMQQLASSNVWFLYLTLASILLFSILLVSEIPMFSLKIKNRTFRGNIKQLVIVFLMLGLFIWQGISGLSWGIVAYIIISIISSLFEKQTVKYSK
ncbi:MAG: CDP-diacylglycerol--serine O-phosphatidyltransferase [Petrimonas sp.]|nr:CDP-diacylglycerol--serine O-phosphatidyltransferase [Dysgonamonadaceae bacterium]MDD3309261.1 CDP-diacylglycerol--serine O-phosphatidyltransferase [Dysgonamonadaceae bacterium]MDD4399333.1 CDP-diacylglycerol--serine O-phosphatidyltransferase [Dysgonamonadaceae bacterium]MEA4997618.1 CDP-diacylglycerol--serine O-phosphatidyltransferase [Petrimonas sp.]MEA5082457.1 CDP-diacylglycerol--serine O-phosphatidyltransferase [Dysgonamonadaceae bacterium]